MLNLKEYKLEDYFDITIFSLVAFYPEIYKYIWVTFSRLGLEIIASNLHYIIWGAFILVFLPVFPQRLRKTDIAICFAIATGLSLFAFFPWHNAFTWGRYFDFVSKVLPFFILGKAYRYDKKHENVICFFAAVTLILAMIYIVFFVIADEGLKQDEMFASYNALYSVLILLNAFFKKKAYIYKCLSVMGVFYLLLLGTRGPVLCVCVFFAMMLLKKVGSVKLIIFSLIGVLLLTVYTASPLYETTLNSISETAEEYGFSTRIFDFMEQEDVFNMTGRDNIQSRVVNAIKKEPFAIRGPYSDWIIISSHYDFAVNDVEEQGTYTHNIFLEMWTHYGLLFGSILILFIVVSVAKLISRTDNDKYFLVCSIICCGFIMLIFSSSYLLKESFFFLMGICFNDSFVKRLES